MPDHLHILHHPGTKPEHALLPPTDQRRLLLRRPQTQFPGEVWHSGYHEHRIRDFNDFEAQKHYIAQNPTRKNYTDYPTFTPSTQKASTLPHSTSWIGVREMKFGESEPFPRFECFRF